MVKKKQNQNIIIAGIATALILTVIIIVLLLGSLSVNFNQSPSTIAVIPLKGEITNSSSYSGPPAAEQLGEWIREADSDPSIAAILLDIDSPGGEIVASKQIVYAIRNTEKPVYAYINSVGASGAYYAASATDYIMSDADSITGSIGVISMLLNFEELFDNLGIDVTIMKKGELKGIGSPFEEMTPEEREVFDEILEQAFQRFKGDVLEFRSDKISKEKFEKVADGRILTGQQAYKAGLVDEIMPKQEVKKRVEEMAGLKNASYKYYEKTQMSFYEILFASGNAFGEGFIASLQAQQTPEIK